MGGKAGAQTVSMFVGEQETSSPQLRSLIRIFMFPPAIERPSSQHRRQIAAFTSNVFQTNERGCRAWRAEYSLTQTKPLKQCNAFGPLGTLEQTPKFLSDPFTRHTREFAGVRRDGRLGLRIEFDPEACDKAYCPKHSQMVLVEAGRRVADCSQDSRFKIGSPAYEVMHFAGCWIAKEPVDRKVTPHGVVLRIGEADIVRAAMIRILALFAESRHLHTEPMSVNEHDAERDPDRACARKYLQHLLRNCVGGDVVILGHEPKQFIPNTATGEPGDMSGRLQR
jgi:hypothetical protein